MPIIKKYKSKVVSIISPVDRVFTIVLKSLEKPFKFEPGQFLHLAIDEFDPSEQWPDSRCFSMQSAPDQEFIKITYSVKGVFTNRMKNELSPGKHVTVKLPYGNLFNQSHNKTNTVFIGGGTGITPFLSLFTHKSFDKYLNPKIYIGFRSSSYNIYKNELAALKSCYSQVFYENSNGPLDILKIFSENSISNDYFISGPPDMIRDFKTALNKNGVPENQIFSDSWD